MVIRKIENFVDYSKLDTKIIIAIDNAKKLWSILWDPVFAEFYKSIDERNTFAASVSIPSIECDTVENVGDRFIRRHLTGDSQ